MKLGIILSRKDPETVWNALRLGVHALGAGDEVSVFLIGEGVEAPDAGTDRFDVPALIEDFSRKGGRLMACGTCLKLRSMEGGAACPVSTLKDLHELVREADRLVTF